MTLKHRTTLNADLVLIHIIQTESADEAAAALAAPALLATIKATLADLLDKSADLNATAQRAIDVIAMAEQKHAIGFTPTEAEIEP